MNYLMLKMLGLLPMEEVAVDGGQSGGGEPAAAPASPAATPAPVAPAQAPAPAGSLLGDLAAPADADAAVPADAEAAAKPEVPEVYDLKAPEGVELDDAVLPQVQDLFKKLGLPQDKAQEVFRELLEIDQARQPTPEQVQQHYEQQAMDLNKQWGDECAKLPELGGENFNKSLEVASQVMVKFGTPELRQFLTYSALGSNPEFFKFIHSIGQSMSQDTMVHGGDARQGTRSIESRLWPET
jgi:hypothetical protein